MNSVSHWVLVLAISWQRSKLIAQKSRVFIHLEATMVLLFQWADGSVFLFCGEVCAGARDLPGHADWGPVGETGLALANKEDEWGGAKSSSHLLRHFTHI